MARLGIDIGGSSVKAARLDGGDAFARVDHEGDVESVALAVASVCRAVGADRADTVGVCLPGLVDPATTEVLFAANLPCLRGVRMNAWVRRAAGVDAVRAVVSDSSAAAVGCWESAPVEGRLLALVMGTGVGAAVVEQGRVLTLDGVSSGHLGQVDVSGGDPAAPVGPDGGRGSLEAYVGWPALRARFGDEAPAVVEGLGPTDPAVRALAQAIRIAHAIYKPDVIRLIGGVGGMLGPIVPRLRSLVDDRLTRVARPGWRLESLDDPSFGARGAAEAAVAASAEPSAGPPRTP